MFEHVSDDPGVRVANSVLRLLLRKRYAAGYAIRFWDGSRVGPVAKSAFTINVHSPHALRVALRPPFDLNAGRAFAAGLLSCEGDVEAAIALVYESFAGVTLSRALQAAALLFRLPSGRFAAQREARIGGRTHSIARDRRAIAFHYDLPASFYRAFLGESMTYSCAYYDDGIESLDVAQYAKIDYALRKLRLKRGERLLDIGCGFGTLVLRAAERFGANAVGVTLSKAQYEEGQRLFARVARGQCDDRLRRLS